jgi:hypothetical protein
MNVQVSTVAMMLVLGSLALIGIGISILVADNERTPLVAAYTAGVQQFQPNVARVERTEMFSITSKNTTILPRFRGKEYIVGYTGDLPEDTAATYGWTALLPIADVFEIRQVIDGEAPTAGGLITTSRLPVTVPLARDIACTADNFDGNTGTCPDDWLQAQCHAITGRPDIGTFVKDPALKDVVCPRDNVICGSCQFNAYLNKRVEYVTWISSENRWQFVANIWPEFPSGVRFPFNTSDNDFSYDLRNPMNFTVKPVGDPYSVMQNLTNGGMDFGQTADDQRQSGLIMVATGSITFVLCVGAIIGVRYMSVASQKKKEKEAEEAAAAAKGAAAGGGDAAAASTGALAVPVLEGQQGKQDPNGNYQQGNGNNNNNNNGNGNGNNQNNGNWGNHGNNQNGGWNNNNGNGGNQQGGWNNNNNSGNNNGGGGNGNNQQGDWNGNGNNQQGGWSNNNNTNSNNNSGPSNPMNRFGNQQGGGGDDDFKATSGPGGHHNRSTRGGGGGGNNAQGRGGSGGRGGGGGYGRRNSNSGSQGNGNSSRTGSSHRDVRAYGPNGSNNSGSGRHGRNSSQDDNHSQNSHGSAAIATALRRGPPPGGRGGGGPGGGGPPPGRPRSNSRGRQRYDDDPDL